LVSEISETSLNQNYGFLNFLRKLKCIRHIKKRIVESMVATRGRCVFYLFIFYQVKTKISLQSSQVSYQITKHATADANNNHTSAQKAIGKQLLS